MSSYTHIDHTGVLDIASLRSIGRTKIITTQGEAKARIHIDNSDAPTVALELLKAAGQESVIVPKSKSKVVERPSGQIQCGSVTVYSGVDHASLLSSAAAFTAIADYVGSKAAREAAEKAEAEAAEKKLQERRDALTKRFIGNTWRYVEVGPGIRNAVDAYIELEDKLAAK